MYQVFPRFAEKASAFSCVREAMARGVSVPDELQIVAYDGTYLTDLAGMTLTAVRQDFPAIAEQVANRMMGLIEGGTAAGVAGAAGAAVDVTGRVGAADDKRSESVAIAGAADDGREPAIAGEAEHLIPVSLVTGATTRG